MYRPTTSVSFSTNCGSLETLKVLTTSKVAIPKVQIPRVTMPKVGEVRKRQASFA
jgi:hypothetical protein